MTDLLIERKRGKVDLMFIVVSVVAVIASFVLHEFSHWLAGTALGYEMHMSLNKAFPARGGYREEWHYMLISAVGPLWTLIQAAIAYVMISRTHRSNWYPVLIAAFLLEVISCVMNYRHVNDLGRISLYLGAGLFTLPIVAVFIHTFLVVRISGKERYTGIFISITLFLILLFTSIWILSNNRFGILLL